MGYAGANWIVESLKVKDISPLGVKVADLLGDVYLGIYHLSSNLLKKVDWSNDYYISVVLYGGLATFDSDVLTRLVLLSHDRMIRVEVNPHAFRYLELCFHQRKTRDDRDWCICMPTLEDHVAELRKVYGEPE